MDKFKIKLEEKTMELKACQSSNFYQSCWECSSCLDCRLRLDYIKSVYESLNKGNGGSFEFN